jgi:hypothetical protein
MKFLLFPIFLTLFFVSRCQAQKFELENLLFFSECDYGTFETEVLDNMFSFQTEWHNKAKTERRYWFLNESGEDARTIGYQIPQKGPIGIMYMTTDKSEYLLIKSKFEKFDIKFINTFIDAENKTLFVYKNSTYLITTYIEIDKGINIYHITVYNRKSTSNYNLKPSH